MLMVSDELVIEEETYVSSKRAAATTSYTQDYIGQLARSGAIDARRVGGLWYVSMPSLEAYCDTPQQVRSEAQEGVTHATRHAPELDSIVSLDGKDYISAGRASEISHYNRDYVGQLARSGAILARQVGNRWYVEKESLLEHKRDKDQLLAAVQAHSVGLMKVEEDRFRVSPIQPASITYVSENMADLTPHIGAKDNNAATDRFDENDTHHVPIRIVRTDPGHEISSTRDTKNKRKISQIQHQMTNISPRLALAGIVPTVIIIASLSFVSIRSQSLYAIGESSLQTALISMTSSYGAGLGEVFDSLFARQIRYQR